MRKIVVLLLAMGLTAELLEADATDLPILLEQLYQQTLAAGYASVDVYYTIQQAFNTAQQVQQFAKQLEAQANSLKSRNWSSVQDWLTGIGDATASYQALRNQLGSISFYFGGRTYQVQDLIPAETHAERIAVAVGALSQATVQRPGESGSSHALRIKAALTNVESEFRQAELIRKEIKKDIVSISADIVKRHDQNNQIIDQLINDSNSGDNAKSLVAQMQIMQQLLGQMTRLMGDANALNANAQLANQGAETERAAAEAKAEALSSKSVELTYPDDSELNNQISNSGISVDDLTGNRQGASGYSPAQ